MKLFLQITLPVLASMCGVLAAFQMEGVVHDLIVDPYVNDDAAIRATYLFNWAILPMLLVVAIVFQALIILPLWRKYERVNRFLGLTRWQMAGMWCLAGSGFVSVLLWVPAFGLTDLLILLTVLFLSLSVYWAVNFWVLNRIEAVAIR